MIGLVLNCDEWLVFVKNFLALVLPSLYALLSRFWITQASASNLAKHISYDYVQTAFEICFEGLPRASYRILGKKWREKKDDFPAGRLDYVDFEIYTTMVVMQYGVLLIFFLILELAAPAFSRALTPESNSLTIKFIRLSVLSLFFNGIDFTNGYLFRSMHRENVPLYSSIAKVSANLILDLLFISPYKVVAAQPTLISQSCIRIVCEFVTLVVNSLFLLKLIQSDIKSSKEKHGEDWKPLTFWSFFNIKIALQWMKHGAWPFFESLVRNTFYLVLVSKVVGLSEDHASAWGTFNSIRWSVIMMPALAAEQSVGALVGRRYAIFRASVGRKLNRAVSGTFAMDTKNEDTKAHAESTSLEIEDPSVKERMNLECKQDFSEANAHAEKSRLTKADGEEGEEFFGALFEKLTNFWLFAPFFWFSAVAVAFEVVIYLALLNGGAQNFAMWLTSHNIVISDLVQSMWTKMDLFFIVFAFTVSLNAGLMAISPPVIFLRSLTVNVLFNGPWIIALSKGYVEVTWDIFAAIFGYVHVSNLVVTGCTMCVVWWGLLRMKNGEPFSYFNWLFA